VSGQKTYWHLEALRRKPSEYEIATTGLLYYPSRGFEVEVPLAEWYRRFQKGSPWILPDPDRFVDARETTYAKYCALQKEKEIYVDGLLDGPETADHDRRLPASWLEILSRVLSPVRFAFHALQMTAAYVGQMAPGSRIVLAALFQCADEMRRIQRVAYRLRQHQEHHAGFGEEGRSLWQRSPAWQPMRQLLERLLVTYDWGEALVALNLVVKPLLDELFMVRFAGLADRSGDMVLARMLGSLEEDCRWHRQWSADLVRLSLQEKSENSEVVGAWIRRWYPSTRQAVEALCPRLGEPEAEAGAIANSLRIAPEAHWRSAGIDRPLEATT